MNCLSMAISLPIACLPTAAQEPGSTAPEALPLQALHVTYEVHPEATTYHAALTGLPASAVGWALFAQAAESAADVSLATSFVAGVAQPGSDSMALVVEAASLANLPVDVPMFLTAAVLHASGAITTTPPVPVLAGAVPCERVSFSFTPDGATLPAGTVVAEQWSAAGIHVAVDNKVPGGPEAALIFDSSNPSAPDPDLATPGYGPDNDQPLGNLLIVAENLVDADGDGLIDVPDDQDGGGVMTFTFDQPATFCALTIVDLENGDNEARFYDADGALLGVLDLPLKGDNSVQTLGTTVFGVSRIEIDVADSFGLPSLDLVLCPTRLRFDLDTAGGPTGLQAGEILSDQLAHKGITVSADSSGAHDAAALFDSGDPTGGDLNLADPVEGLVLILPENLVDADGDGLIDVPDDDLAGGVLVIEFDYDVAFHAATVLDVDTYETSYFELYDQGGALLATVPLAPLGDGSKQTVAADVEGVRRVELVLGGSGALAELVYCPELLAGAQH